MQYQVGSEASNGNEPFQHVTRREDWEFLTGRARYLDDLREEGLLHAVFVRSPHAHALIRSIDTSGALACEGVVGVLTEADLSLASSNAAGRKPANRPVLARRRVRFVGEAVAVLIANTSMLALDAVQRVVVDYETLSAVTDPFRSAEPGAQLLFPSHGSNVVADSGANEDPGFFAEADLVFHVRNDISRVAAVTMETNGCLAVPVEGGRLVVYVGVQSLFAARRDIARALGIPKGHVRVVAPCIGGGFGAKYTVYPEAIATAAAARRLGRPVKFVETRSESMLAMTNGRGQLQTAEVGVKRDGTIVALRAHVVGDAGAYTTRALPSAAATADLRAFLGRLAATVSARRRRRRPRRGPMRAPGPYYHTAIMASGPYRIPKIDVRVTIVVTNRTPIGPYRGAGRPEAAVLLERTIDTIARELDIDPAEVRRRNFIPSDAFPYKTPVKTTYDSGNYGPALEEALRLAGYEALRREQSERRERGDRMQLGIGLASYVEISGGGSEFGAVEIERDGSVTVITGSVPHGQGHETAYAQIASGVLGVSMGNVHVVHGDTDRVARGTGTFGSRSLQVGGSAVLNASTQVLELARQVAAEKLEAAPADIVVHDGGLGVAGAPATALSWADLAADGHLRAELDFAEDGTFPFGTHVAVVEVDTETGETLLVRVVAVDDCGRVINPLLVEGQVHGGIAQGSAQVLYEGVSYDEDGNPQTSTLVTYGIPSAAELISFETARTETPSPNNPLGAKGIGESGTTGSLCAVWNAVVDALSPYGVTDIELPATPERVWRAIQLGRHR
jgi:aerobic carbon-monoxide dehydrogenase large subunit